MVPAWLNQGARLAASLARARRKSAKRALGRFNRASDILCRRHEEAKTLNRAVNYVSILAGGIPTPQNSFSV